MKRHRKSRYGGQWRKNSFVDDKERAHTIQLLVGMTGKHTLASLEQLTTNAAPKTFMKEKTHQNRDYKNTEWMVKVRILQRRFAISYREHTYHLTDMPFFAPLG